MADEFDPHHTNTNWPWEASRSNSITSSIDGSVSVSGSSMVFQDHHHEKLNIDHHHGLQMMGLGLPSSQAMDWNQDLIRSGKHEGGHYRTILDDDDHDQQNMVSNINYQHETNMPLTPQQQYQWRTHQKIFSGVREEDSPINQGLSNNVTRSNFQIDHNSSIYDQNPSPSTMLQQQGFLGSSHYNHHQQQHEPNPIENHHSYASNYVENYGIMNPNDQVLLPKFSHFMRSNTTSPPKQLQFSNNATFWNPSAGTTNMSSDHVPMSFLSNSMQQQAQFSTPLSTFDEKTTKSNLSDVRSSSSTAKKSSSEGSTAKRPRNETSSSPLPAFKVRKEKMGDRITKLQQLVSPFGKTDTASVLSEAIEYIKFLHDQVAVLSTSYMKSGGSIQQHHQSYDKSNKDAEVLKQDLRGRGLCLVPISSTFPVAHETTVDFWTPTFGGTFR